MMRKERCRDSSDQNKSKLQYFGFHGTSLMMHPKTSRRQKERRDWGRFRLKVKPSLEDLLRIQS